MKYFLDEEFLDDDSEEGGEGASFYRAFDGDTLEFQDSEDSGEGKNGQEEEEVVDNPTFETSKIKRKAGIFETSGTQYTPPSSQNLCVFTALARFREPKTNKKERVRFTLKAQALFCQWFEEMFPEKIVFANKFNVYNKDFPGLKPSELPAFEKMFNVRVELYRRVHINTTKGKKI